ncbi:MAG: DUF2309 domain-containing protein [Gammaproteobacteria bacterium]|nr:DUF2309 domain-containing protein [Gammaproteobacteria bacterium]
MTPTLGQHLQIRSMIYVAGEPIPYFWPMRSFIHHNPLHGLEQLPFVKAVAKGTQLFEAKGFLRRSQYQALLADGRIRQEALDEEVDRFVARYPEIPGIDLRTWLLRILRERGDATFPQATLADADDVLAVMNGGVPVERPIEPGQVVDGLKGRLTSGLTVYETVDRLYDTGIGNELDERLVKACLDFFDEGQSVWDMPQRQEGFFRAWVNVAGRDVTKTLRLLLGDIPHAELTAETVIDRAMRALEVPESQWVEYFTRELARLHGWAGFIRWRAGASHYHWSKRHPGDQVDFVAVRLLLSLTLLRKRRGRHRPGTLREIAETISDNPAEIYLRLAFHGDDLLPALAQRVERELARGDRKRLLGLFTDYVDQLRRHEAQQSAAFLTSLASGPELQVLRRLSPDDLRQLLKILLAFEQREGMAWLRSLERHAIDRLLAGINLEPAAPREKRPFAQAMFCIDTRSERIRRHLESVGDYQTYGIAGFFGVPLSFMELGKGSENHLCPVLLTPKNLVLEMTTETTQTLTGLTALEKVLHELKESVLTPFVTVEAIGLLFGFDMIGKTLAPAVYQRLRKRLHEHKPRTHLLLDKLNREQADSILRAAQRAIIVKAVEQELQFEPERITDDMIRGLREAAMGHEPIPAPLAAELKLDDAGQAALLERLRTGYRINPAFARLQMERLGRIGFSLEEQTRFVLQALMSIGLNRDFSRFILLVGHGSTSDNNPFESALDCGACGGSHGLVSARVLAQMANKPEIRRRLKQKGIDIADDAWFVPAMHNTTTDQIDLFDLELLPPSHLVYLDRLRSGLGAAARLCAQERLPSLQASVREANPTTAFRGTQRNAVDWSQVRPEWGLSRNAYFVIGRRSLTESLGLDGRAFLHSYDYRLDPRQRLLENILTGPLVVGQWINMEHYFSTVDNERFGSGSKVYHNVAGRFGVMTGNVSDLRTGLPSQTVLKDGQPYHEPMRLITVIEAPFAAAQRAVDSVVAVKRLVRNGWIRLLVIDPETATICQYDSGQWYRRPHGAAAANATLEELCPPS